MKRSTPLLWISFGLAALTLSILLMGDFVVNLIPDPYLELFTHRQKYSEALAVQYSLLARDGDSRGIQEALNLLVERNEDILSAALVLVDDTILALAGPHWDLWASPSEEQSSVDHIQIPIYNLNQLWGTLQLRFDTPDAGGWKVFLKNPWFRFVGLVFLASFFGYFVYMKRTLRQLDPTSVVPLRVKAAFDVLTEGVVLLDMNNRVVLANRAFGQILEIDPRELVGKSLDEFGWATPDPLKPLMTYPWKTARENKCVELDFPLMWEQAGKKSKKFRVNCTPILDERSWVRGLLVSFDDVTTLDETIRELKASKAELESLALRDPLTGCFNRRALFEAFEDQWEVADRQKTDMVCIMADIDHFKSYNDRFGHAVGDQVIQVVGKVLGSTIRPLDILGRYGGEEFCILLPGQSCSDGLIVAERLRRGIERQASLVVRTTDGKKITMSFGVSARALGASDPLELIDQADKALYAAKEGGRNLVGMWSEDGPLVQNPEMAGMANGRVS